MPKVNFTCKSCGGKELVDCREVVQYHKIDRMALYAKNQFGDWPTSDNFSIMTTSGHREEAKRSELPWSTYRCYDCKTILPLANSEDLWEYLTSNNMLDYEN